ncbi:hypothetical protein [Novilysobacter spongiicola]|uniref:Outer membrane lipoprotein-sorting protein n=1 Tax=Lysobacter spongiicola DSM 21749 TaxID=1122188 RepID=A0A1T4PZ57_9GAMM|nr:hypothetical protein [Lysobacter spongiicola]SJZ96551.1 hypothetical protein SAMN02745674_01389 [Lysobacter spongiicola DSM 21749]
MRSTALVAYSLSIWIATSGVAAVASDDVPHRDVTLHAEARGIGPVRETEILPLTIRLSGSHLRIDFESRSGEDGYLLADTTADARQAWMVSRSGDVALPVPAPGWTTFRLDPEAPCADMAARCEPESVDVVANRLVRKWRYRDADGRGPDGTDTGTLWVDPQTGLLLAFKGRLAGRGDVRGYKVTAVEHTPMSPDLFELPRTLDQAEADARNGRTK